ncbi:MAG: hypothetical protein CFE24_05295 [Flavobacterium sp. BFFFF2]|nr:MAG: hypothetical protein CFE24_05295 [Flavobacterium sp. BFFFF2]
MKPIERVKLLIEKKGLSISAFERQTGMSNNSIQTAIKRKANLKDDTLNHIIEAFPDVSVEWLLLGKGNMFKNEQAVMQVQETEIAYDSTYIINLQKEYIEKLKAEINLLKNEDTF